MVFFERSKDIFRFETKLDFFASRLLAIAAVRDQFLSYRRPRVWRYDSLTDR
jgi:hypothetical protein